ncbi:MAG: hypothetical protein FWG98_08245 [Candidatus Cloacimonetes bacterium]|nr:hypothetical protein [Candidatus Cloacimonadota bacterium]
MINSLKVEANKHGDKLGLMAFDHFEEIKQDLENLGFNVERYFDIFTPNDLGFEVKSVIVVAYATPLVSMDFAIEDKIKTIYISPGYYAAHNKEKIIFEYLSPILNKEGFHISEAKKLPCKSVAVRTGLGVYGRNNIVYVDGMGSFCRFAMYLTDLPSDDEFYDGTAHLRYMKSCAECLKCVNHCPTQALNINQNTVDISRCLCWMTLMDVGSPDWVNLEWHNALFGCMMCQKFCPQNIDFMRNVARIGNYDELQTKAVLDNNADAELINSFGCGSLNRLIPRNLKILIVAEDSVL